MAESGTNVYHRVGIAEARVKAVGGGRRELFSGESCCGSMSV